ncbi:unnamed protein product [Protopolystoma xenopodis]|uniref:Uncharacterized protein n=1 Tax=Protopolystoma xenopodis TaxID=117903 RepID=A0A448WVB4_9PLAT|nr:unnamed protein product [Protopolystoma xenopodis]
MQLRWASRAFQRARTHTYSKISGADRRSCYLGSLTHTISSTTSLRRSRFIGPLRRLLAVALPTVPGLRVAGIARGGNDRRFCNAIPQNSSKRPSSDSSKIGQARQVTGSGSSVNLIPPFSTAQSSFPRPHGSPPPSPKHLKRSVTSTRSCSPLSDTRWRQTEPTSVAATAEDALLEVCSPHLISK